MRPPPRSIIIETPPKGCYNALNQGNTPRYRRHYRYAARLRHVCQHRCSRPRGGCICKENHDFIYGDVKYIKASSPQTERRYYSARGFTPEMMLGHSSAPPFAVYQKKCARQKKDYTKKTISPAPTSTFSHAYSSGRNGTATATFPRPYRHGAGRTLHHVL